LDHNFVDDPSGETVPYSPLRLFTNCSRGGGYLRVRSEAMSGLQFSLSGLLIGSGSLRCSCALVVPCGARGRWSSRCELPALWLVEVADTGVGDAWKI